MVQAIPFIIMAAAAAIKTVGESKNVQAQAKFKRQQFEEQIEVARLRATTDVNERMKQLNRTIGTQRAISAVTGAETLDGSNAAIEQDTRNIANFDIRQRNLNFQLEKSALNTKIAQARTTGKLAKRALKVSLFTQAGAQIIQGRASGAFAEIGNAFPKTGSGAGAGATSAKKTTGRGGTRTKSFTSTNRSVAL